MSIISSYSNQFKRASKLYEKAKSNTFSKKNEYNEAKKYEDDCKGTFFTKGLLYYDIDKRTALLNSAEQLCYSQNKIDHLKTLDSDKWNSDNVKVEDIIDLQAIEDFVEENNPRWKKNFFTKIGEFLDE